MRHRVAQGLVLGAVVTTGVAMSAPTVHAADMSLDVTRVAAGLSSPVYVTAPKGDDRLFIVEKGGMIKVRDSAGNITPFLDLTASVNPNGERGLLGMAFDPGFATNGRFYVDYIDNASTDTIVASYTVSGAIPLQSNTVNLASRQGVLRFAQTGGQTNHKAGWIGFRPGDDDNLYIATGDGGGGQAGNGQNNSTLLGKILRIDPTEGGLNPDNNYTIPAGNPTSTIGSVRPENLGDGLRNPSRNSFDALTGDFFIADVGEGTREEVNRELAGAGGGQNYGWNVREGRGLTGQVAGTGTVGSFTDPVYDYNRALGQAITGGYVYRGSEVPELYGKYVFGDYVSNRLFVLDPAALPAAIDSADDLTPLFPAGSGWNLSGISSFGEGGFGQLYIVDYGGGEIFTFVPTAVPEPSAMAFAILMPAVVALGRRRHFG